MLLPRRGEATECLRSNMADGVRQQSTPIERMEDTEEVKDVGMEREDLGQMTFTFCEVSFI